MKKNFKFYVIAWAILLAIYNVAVFLVQPIVPNYVINYDLRFWISWNVIVATYLGQLFCAKVAFDSKSKEKLFLNLPLITESYASLITATIIGSILMLIPDCPAWIAAIICVAVLGFSVISIIKAKAAADVVCEIDDKIKSQTSFIKTLTVDAENLVSRAKSESIKAQCEKVYEAVRYSDPMSNEAFATIESEITIKFSKLSEAVISEDSEVTAEVANELVILLGDRNKKCKLLK